MVRRWELTAYALLIALTMLRIGSTWRVFSQTMDEGVHVLAGLQWLAEKKYDIEQQHPPLARVVVAVPLWLAGARDGHDPNVRERVNDLLLTNGRYVHNMALIRCGNLLFVALAIVAVAFWARRTLTPIAAFLATALFASLPPLLAHGGLATTDMSACATFAIAIVTLHRWLDQASCVNALLLGSAVGLGAISKYSFLAFFGATALAILALRWRSLKVARLGTLVISAIVALLLVAIVYRGQIGEWLWGIRVVAAHAKQGHLAYLFGRRSQMGWWYYFPIALLFKTPLPLFAMAAIGWRAWKHHLDAVAAAAIVMIIAMFTPINIGIRHILPIYAPLAILAGAGIDLLWQTRRVIALVLCAWLLGGSGISHPDYIPWFNELALGHGERILADSNFDWGQDVLRLRNICKDRKIDSLAFEVFTSAPLDALGLPPRRRIRADQPTVGWYAISETVLTAAGGEEAYPYVTRHPLTLRAGKTIRLYEMRIGQ